MSRDRKAAEHRMAEIVRDVERAKGGLGARAESPSAESLATLARKYEQHLLDLGRSEQHASDTRRQVITAAADCGWVTVADVSLSRWVRWVGQVRRDGLSAETVNHYLRSLRAFFRWGFGEDPLRGADLLNAEADRRIRRRALTPAEFERFIRETREGGWTHTGLDGASRAALYLIAARTGLRAGVLAGLRRCDLRIEDPVPHIPTEARSQKNRKVHHVPIPKSVVAEVADWLASRPADGLLWPGKWHEQNRGAIMVRRDLRAAGIAEETADGGYDFHALRKQCGTDLARAGVPLVMTQRYLGHSTPALTAKLYVGIDLADLGAAADQLGSGLGPNKPKQPETNGRSRPK